jgi:hypothetical protein
MTDNEKRRKHCVSAYFTEGWPMRRKLVRESVIESSNGLVFFVFVYKVGNERLVLQ